ncbi:MAG: hypothetical protein ABIK99_03580 [candidate division WOR-3 bacterium]
MEKLKEIIKDFPLLELSRSPLAKSRSPKAKSRLKEADKTFIIIRRRCYRVSSS